MEEEQIIRIDAAPVVVDAGHFVWEDQADEYSSLIADWVADGYREAAAGRPRP